MSNAEEILCCSFFAVVLELVGVLHREKHHVPRADIMIAG